MKLGQFLGVLGYTLVMRKAPQTTQSSGSFPGSRLACEDGLGRGLPEEHSLQLRRHGGAEGKARAEDSQRMTGPAVCSLNS